MIWMLLSTALAAPTLHITGSCPGTVRVEVDDGVSDTRFAMISAVAPGSSQVPSPHPCAGTALPVRSGLRLRARLSADADGQAVRVAPFPASVCTSYVVALDELGCAASAPVQLSTLCPDADLDGVCDVDDLCVGDDATGDSDGDAICDDTDTCTGDDTTGDADGDSICDDRDACAGDDATGDTDADGVCDDTDACFGDDTTGDTDLDGVCDDADLCFGDDGTGDADVDGVCDDIDACVGDDASGDTDLDGLCDDSDLCFGTDTTGDTDADGVCDDVDLCTGDDATGDTDSDGVCDDNDVCTGDDTTGDSDADGTCDDVDPCFGDQSLGDADSDGVCDDNDVCTGDDTTGDADADGFCADTDLCDDRYNPGQEPICGVWFVDDDATGNADGLTWADAFTTIQDAVNAASSGDQIWLAVGTYGPSAASTRVASLIANLSIYGGFDGDELDLADRAGRFAETIVTGDFLGDDDGTAATVSDNSKPVFHGADDDVFDGFVIQGGYASGGTVGANGAGVRLNQAQGVVFRNMIFRGNRTASGAGGAAIGLVQSSRAEVHHSLFVDNYSVSGTIGGQTGGQVRVYDSAFVNNGSSAHGADIGEISNTYVSGCSFYGSYGGPASVQGANLTVLNSVFYPDGIPAMVDDNGAAVFESNAAPEDYSAYGSNVWLDGSTAATSDPFTLLASGELFLNAITVARDFGDSDIADVDVPDWASTTTSMPDLGLDADPVDLGMHFDPSLPYIESFESGATLTWSTSDNVVGCDLDDGGTVYVDAVSGTLAGSGGPYLLTCRTAAGASTIAE